VLKRKGELVKGKVGLWKREDWGRGPENLSDGNFWWICLQKSKLEEKKRPKPTKRGGKQSLKVVGASQLEGMNHLNDRQGS